MTKRYASRTTVSAERSRMQIEHILRRYGADQFSYGCDDQRAMAVIQFRARDRAIRFVLTLPKPTDKDMQCDGRGSIRSPRSLDNAADAEKRRRWRALLICIKAKLEAVESKIEDFEEAFMAHIVLPDDTTAAEWLRPQIALAYESGKMPQTLPALPAPEARE